MRTLFVIPVLLAALALDGCATPAATDSRHAFHPEVPGPYDIKADAPAEVKVALERGAADHRPTLLVFGANWCGDCRALDKALHDPDTSALVAHDFNVVKIDVGNFDRNMPLSMQFGNPIAGGIPAVVLLAPDRSVVYSSKAGELANARTMSASGIRDFLAHLSTLVPAATTVQ